MVVKSLSLSRQLPNRSSWSYLIALWGSWQPPVSDRFSGDTIVTWESLAFQPYFTSTASNIGYTWWSHDIGGHMRGYYDEDLALRWLQFGVFSPINRLHSSCNAFNSKEPWFYSSETCRWMKRYLRLRHSLLPYLYTMNVATHEQGLPLVQPSITTIQTKKMLMRVKINISLVVNSWWPQFQRLWILSIIVLL